MRVNVYVDGFNLYYRALKGGPHKWLDLNSLAQKLLPTHTINRIRYFTALVKPRPSDPQEPVRQQTYIRALKTFPHLTVHLGTFMDSRVRSRLVVPLADGTTHVEVHKTEEKGSDVNFATHMLLDAFRGDFEGAAVITNDSDLAEPVRVVRDELKLDITVIDPCGERRVSRELKASAKFYRPLRMGAIGSSQLPPTLQDAAGTITKPSTW